MRIEKRAAIVLLLLIVGALMLIYGAWRDETELVFHKAVKICLECVGIG